MSGIFDDEGRTEPGRLGRTPPRPQRICQQALEHYPSLTAVPLAHTISIDLPSLPRCS